MKYASTSLLMGTGKLEVNFFVVLIISNARLNTITRSDGFRVFTSIAPVDHGASPIIV
ncbi:MAG: hypothetical protein JSV05_05765 [Candidatus Bathyarchaeota archaeon]|nr:MAG: hypothetical protein JSV05_05765 [Candidatus Bathyarchaeota archaeon]